MGQNVRAVRSFSINPTIDTAAYATGDQVGPGSVLLLDAAEAGALLLATIIVVDKSKQKAALDIVIYNSLPTITSVDNGAWDLTDAEALAKIVGVVNVPTANYVDSNSNSIATVKTISLLVAPKKNTANPLARNLYVGIVSRGTPTYTSTTDLGINFLFEAP